MAKSEETKTSNGTKDEPLPGEAGAKLGEKVDHEVFEDLTDEEADALRPEHLAKLDEIDAKNADMDAAREKHRKAMREHREELKELEAEEHRLRSAVRSKQRKRVVHCREVMIYRLRRVHIRELLEDGQLGEVLDERDMTPEEQKNLSLFDEHVTKKDDGSATLGEAAAAKKTRKKRASKGRGRKGSKTTPAEAT